MNNIYYFLLVICVLTSCNSSQEQNADNLAQAKAILANNDLNSGVDQQADGTIQATFVHTVFFWMKEDITEDERKSFEAGLEKLGKNTPSILSYRWGKPAGTPREVVDNSYTYAWIVDFASSEDQDAYQDDPVHLAFIEESKDLWTKVQVYDTILE